MIKSVAVMVTVKCLCGIPYPHCSSVELYLRLISTPAFSSLLLFVVLWLRSAQVFTEGECQWHLCECTWCAVVAVKSNELLLQHSLLYPLGFILCACFGGCTKQCCAQLRVHAHILQAQFFLPSLFTEAVCIQIFILFFSQCKMNEKM